MKLPNTLDTNRSWFGPSTLSEITPTFGELQRLQRQVEAELASFTPALLVIAFRGEL
jgi:hypothetical protein